jgi:hypothetical protein
VRYADTTPHLNENTSMVHVDTAQAAIDTVANTSPRHVNYKLWTAVLCAAVLAGCASKGPSAPPPPASAPATAPAPAPAAAAASSSNLPPVASWAEYRRRAAKLIMAANTANTFTGPLQEPMWGVPSVTVMMNADGTVRLIDMLRSSKIAPESNTLAQQAVRRVANFGSVANLPRPWQFNETFLYNDNKRFQLDTIVSGR